MLFRSTLFFNSSDTLFTNSKASFSVYNQTGEMWNWEFFTSFYLEGYNKNDTYAHLKIRKLLKTKKDSTASLELYANYSKQSPDYFLSNYRSNHYKWRNSFPAQEEKRIELTYHKPSWHLSFGLKATAITNYVYFDTTGHPAVFNQNTNVLAAFVNKSFHAGGLGIDNKITWQFVSDKNIIPLPEIALYNSVYYGTYLFNKAILVNIGFDVFYNTAFYSQAYIPAINQFRNQNEKLIGNYPFIDVFLRAQIKRANLFVKFAHVNSGFFENTYFATLHYPALRRAFKFGVSWRFIY